MCNCADGGCTGPNCPPVKFIAPTYNSRKNIAADEQVLVEWFGGSEKPEKVVGPATKVDYGRKRFRQRFWVSIKDATAQPDIFKRI